jgi:predicted secreted hydrolase
MATQGTITVDGTPYAVSGLSWMDHEWSTSALGAEVAGWDWFSIQLDDRREIMLPTATRTGPATRCRAARWSRPTARHLTRDEVTIAVQGEWRSPETGTTYPAGWRFGVPSAGIDLTLTPYLASQELRVSFAYWEGAVRVAGTAAGDGYVELTGYAMGR